MSEQKGEKAGLTDDESEALQDGFVGSNRRELEEEFDRPIVDAIERIIAARVAAAKAEALREAARLPATVLGDAWDSNGFALGMRPPWSYLRRFLNAVADAVGSSLSPVPQEDGRA